MSTPTLEQELCLSEYHRIKTSQGRTIAKWSTVCRKPKGHDRRCSGHLPSGPVAWETPSDMPEITDEIRTIIGLGEVQA